MNNTTPCPKCCTTLEPDPPEKYAKCPCGVCKDLAAKRTFIYHCTCGAIVIS